MRRVWAGLLAGCLAMAACNLWAQDADDPNLRDIVEAEAHTEELLEEAKSRARDGRSDRSTPRATLLSLGVALDAGDLEAAAESMDMRYLPSTISVEDGPKLIGQLRYIFRRHVWIDIGLLSDRPEGYLDDGLPSYRELFGTIETADGPVELYLQKVPGPDGGTEWKVSNATVRQIPELWEEFGYGALAAYLKGVLPAFEWLGMDNWQWAVLLVYVLTLALVVYLLIRFLDQRGEDTERAWMLDLRRHLLGPLGFFVYITALRLFMLEMGLSVKARAIFDSFVLEYLTYVFLVLGLINMVAYRARRRMIAAGHPEATVVVRPIASVVKMAAAALLIVIGMDNAGYDVTTIIAGLGVSSIAVALAAQSTLENLIGAITLYIARPFKPGDFCRVGDKVGAVEEIGLRSTLLRTLDRTIVNIPNGELAKAQIVNFARRDNIRFYRMLNLRLSTTPDQLRFLLARLRELLYAHPFILSPTISVRFFDITNQACLVRMDSRVATKDFQEYLAIAEDINLRIIDLVHEAGTNFAYPSQTIMMEDANRPDEANKARAEETVERWREQDEYPFPQWSDEHVAKINDTLDYPPEGSPYNPRNKEMGIERG